MMKTGIKELDNYINLDEAEIVILNNTDLYSTIASKFSHQIASNVCLKQENEVLEIVNCSKEYIIKEIFNEESQIYLSEKEKYTDEQLKQIGQATLNLFGAGKRLPTIIEQETMNLADIRRCINSFTKYYKDIDNIDLLMVLDLFPLNSRLHINSYPEYRKQSIKILKSICKLLKKIRCPAIIVYNGDIEEILKYIDKYIIAKESEDAKTLEIYDKYKIIGKFELKQN